MKLYLHFIISIALSAVLYPFYGNYSFLALATGYLIDIDHFFIYISKFRDFHPVRAYKSLNREMITQKDLPLFHSVELIIPAFALPYHLAVPSVIGFFVHMFCDLADELFIIKQRIKAFSLIYWALRRRQ